MGHSRTFNFHCTTYLSDGTQFTHGGNSFKEIRGIQLSEQQYQDTAPGKGNKIVKTAIFSQTKAGAKRIIKDFAIMDNQGKIDHYSYQDTIPFYSF